MLPQKNKMANLMLQLLTVFIGALLILLLVIPLLGPIWHLLHGNFVSYGVWRIPVPSSFYVRKSEKGPTMWKHTFGAPFFATSYGHISLFSLSPDQLPFAHDRDYFRFEKRVTQEAGQYGYQLESQRTISVGKDSAYCLAFMRPANEPRSLVRCVVENSVMVLFYEGDPRYIPDVFSALHGMSLERTAGGPDS